MEAVDIYDRNKQKKGYIKYRGKDNLEEGEYALAARAIIINSDKKILISRRALYKKHGGYWEANGGNALAGETSKECVIREVREELGFDLNKYEGILFKETISKVAPVFDDIYLYKIDININELTPNKEVMDVKWVSIEEYEELNNQNIILHYHEFTEEDYYEAIKLLNIY